MDRSEFQKVADLAIAQRACSLVELLFNDDDNVFEIVIAKKDGSPVALDDCEFIHRAILAAFDRNIEDYSLTVGSVGIDPAEADALLEEE